MTNKTTNKSAPEIRQRAMRMVIDNERDDPPEERPLAAERRIEARWSDPDRLGQRSHADVLVAVLVKQMLPRLDRVVERKATWPPSRSFDSFIVQIVAAARWT